jgi:hypothetical protein
MVTAHSDSPVGTMFELTNSNGQFTDALLRPLVTPAMSVPAEVFRVYASE